MTFSFSDCLDINTILADVLVAAGDEKQKNFTKGWYQRQIKDGLDKMNYQSPFLPTFTDIPLTSNLIIPVPSGVFDTIDLFLWNGGTDCDGVCKISDAVRLFHKRGMMTKGKTFGYTARNVSTMSDAFLPVPYLYDSSTYFYNIVNGSYMLSDICADYDNLRIVYYGVPKSIDVVKFIPPFLKQFLIAWGVERAFYSLKVRDDKWIKHWQIADADLYQRKGTEPSKFDSAQSLLKRVDTKEWNDLSEYLSQLYF